MKRISDEDGANAGARNIGRLALMGIPLLLALGATAWLSFYMGVHSYRHELSQEDRAAIAVGAEPRPQEKIKVILANEAYGCTPITRADLDGRVLRLYARNDCHETLTYLKWHWSMLSPNGTVLHTSYTNQCAVPNMPSDSAECVFEPIYGDSDIGGIPVDDRSATLRVWATPRP